MTFISLGFFTGLSLILAIGAQNVFVIEQGLKKNYIFLVCFICSISDAILIFFGILIFSVFQNYFTPTIELVLNILLFLFLINFIWKKINENITNINFVKKESNQSKSKVLLKTLVFTYLNPHVYSDTVFFIGNISKNFLYIEKIHFGIGASIASFLFFYLIGYLANYFSNYLNSPKVWNRVNKFIIIFMLFFTLIVLQDILAYYSINIDLLKL